MTNDADKWITCDRGCIHWGGAGAAGLMLHNNGRYLLQQRSRYVDHGLTWAPPSGALRHGEHPINGAVREAREEMGEFPFENPQVVHTTDHGGWAFHTVAADAPHQFEPQLLDHESEDAGWFTPAEIDELPLHPGFRESWNELRPQPPQQRFAQKKTPATEDGGLTSASLHKYNSQIADIWRPVKAMAADPYWLDDYINRNGPYLYHRTEPHRVQSILQEGLKPWDAEGQEFTSDWQPRPGHVYMTGSKPRNVNQRPEYVRIDMRKLDPQRLNPDDDYMAIAREEHGLWPEIPYDPDSTTPEEWGQTLHDYDVSSPSQTAWSLEYPDVLNNPLGLPKSIAYQGTIPPEAISHPYSSRIASQELDEFVASLDAHGYQGSSDFIWSRVPMDTATTGKIADVWRPVKQSVKTWGEWPEASEDFHYSPEGFSDELPSHVYRAMSEEDFQRSMQRGWHQSDERGNYIGQKAADPEGWGEESAPAEGTVAGRWAYPGYLLNSDDGVGRIVKIKVEPNDGWEPHPDDDEGGYFRTFKPIPTDRFEDWTDPHHNQTWAPIPRVGGQELDEFVAPNDPKDMPDEGAQILDHLSLRSVAHNLHYKAERGPLTEAEARDYATQLLELIGYRNPDPITVNTALQGWQQLYPQDRMLPAPTSQAQIIGSITRDPITGQPSIEPWTPGTWGKGMLVDGRPHVWQVENPGGSPHHMQYGRTLGYDPATASPEEWERYGDYIQIAPDGSYTLDPQGTKTRTPETFARSGLGLRYIRDPAKWQMRAFSKIADQRGWTDFYHVSPRANRESIQNLGLMGDSGSSPWSDPWRRNQPYGNYMFDNPQDAENYAHTLRDQDRGNGYDDEEDRYDYPELPEGFDEWPEERQDEWHDGAGQPAELTEDPYGYDIWKVNTRGLPIHRDPESAINQSDPLTPRQLQDDYRDLDYPDLHGAMGGEPWTQQLVDHIDSYGGVPRRYYTPEQVDRGRLQLHQHLPRWNMADEGWYEEPETREQEVPLAWDEMQLRRPQFPAHSKVAETLYHWTDASDLHDWMDPSHTGPGETYLTRSGDAPDNESWNPDVPIIENPVRLTIDTDHLDPEGFDRQYGGWLGNELYRGVIPPEAIKQIKPFKKAPEWNLPQHMDPTPQDAWPEWGEASPDQQRHDLQWTDDGRSLGPTS